MAKVTLREGGGAAYITPTDWEWRGSWYVYSSMVPRAETLLAVVFSYAALQLFVADYVRPGEAVMYTKHPHTRE